MKPPGVDTWLIPDGVTVEQVVQAVASGFTLAAAPEYAATVVYADSFDWRLYQRGYILHCHARVWTLYHGDDSGEVTVQQGGPRLQGACMAQDFPPGDLQAILTPLLGCRCLLPVATVRLAGRQIRLLNSDDKTVARLVIEEQQPTGKGPRYQLIRLFALRGYDDEAHRVQRLLEANGVTATVSPLLGFEEGCRAAGRRPLDYSGKFNVALDHGMTARQAMVQIYSHLLATMEHNIPGMLSDWDSEFLHDFRVAIRRTRSGLSLVKQVLPEATINRFKRDFGVLGSLTGPTRDLDVYLLMREDYLARLPEPLRDGLQAFFADMALRRQVEQAKLVKALQSKKIQAILAAWKRYLQKTADRRPAPKAALAIAELAGRIIMRRYKRVIKDGRALNAGTPAEAVHRLRIQGKKLRYAIEFFSSLFPEKEIQHVVRQLKGLQDILGSFNDLAVQQQVVQDSLASLAPQKPASLATAAALGALLQSLSTEQLALRTHFAETFAQFSGEENTAFFYTLFAPKQDEA